MTLQTQHTVNVPATLTDEQRQRVSDALENAQSVNTRRNYAGQFRKFRSWCQGEGQSALPASPEVVAAYAAELVAEGKSMSTVRLAVSAIVDVHRRVDLESPVNAGVSVTLRGLARRVGVNQKQAGPLDVEALAAVRATAFTSLSCAFTLGAGTRSRRSRPTNFLPQSWREARGLSMAMSLCRHSSQTKQHRPSNSRRLCSQAIVLDVFVYVTAWLAAPLRTVR